MRAGVAVIVAGLALLCAPCAIAQAPADPGVPKLVNPRGQDPAPIVKEVMKKYGLEDGDAAFREKGMWVFGSETSATVALETTQRTNAVLEYGETEQYGKRIVDGEAHYIHVFHLSGLQPDRTYHFRMTGTAFNGRKAVSKDCTVKTATPANAVRVPGDMQGPPYELNKANTYYLVTADIKAPKTAFNISAPGITLDLGGHAITYNEEHLGLPTNEWTPQRENSAFGIRCYKKGEGGADTGTKIYNGTIRQGKGEDEAAYTTLGFNPVFVCSGADAEVAGITCIYGGTQLSGIYFQWGAANKQIHHNVIQDLGKRITDRHQMCSAVVGGGGAGARIYNNLIQRARQTAFNLVGLDGCETFNNEANLESYSVNSYGVRSGPKARIHDNRIFGCGDNVVGIVLNGTAESRGAKAYNNYIWLQAHALGEIKEYLNDKEMESSDVSIMSGIRTTWGFDDIEFYNNTILVTGREGGQIRGTFLSSWPEGKDALCRDSLIIALSEDDATTGWGAVAGVGKGNGREPGMTGIVFRNNTIVSNFADFNMQDTYGTGTNYTFIGCKFVKVGDNPKYLTIRRSSGYSSKGHVFIDSAFEGGAGYDKTSFNADEDITVQWTLAISAPAGAGVSVKDKDGKEVFSGRIGADGKLAVPLSQYKQEGSKKTVMTPHTVVVTADGKTARKTVTMDRAQEVPDGALIPTPARRQQKASERCAGPRSTISRSSPNPTPAGTCTPGRTDASTPRPDRDCACRRRTPWAARRDLPRCRR